jgi:hypothetical protein
VRWDGAGEGKDAGMDAPSAAPSLTLDSTPNYYIARCDVTKPGACYFAPPVVSFLSNATPDVVKHRQAKAQSYLSQASVAEIQVRDGGKYYPDPPAASLSATCGSGAVLKATLDTQGLSVGTKGDPFTGITEWKVVSAPSVADDEALQRASYFAAIGTSFIEIAITGNGTFSTPNGAYIKTRTAGGTINCGVGVSPPAGYTPTLTYTVSGYQGGAGAIVRLLWYGGQWISTCATGVGGWSLFTGAKELSSVLPMNYGANYKDTSSIQITIYPVDGENEPIVVEGYTSGNPQNTTARRFPVKSIVIQQAGTGYLVAPQLKMVSDSGFGAYATCTVKGGKIDTVTLLNSGGGYKTPPVVEVVSGGAEAFAVARPHLRGTYQCYYRFIDDTPEDRGGPIPSSLSPLTEVDAGEAATSIQWSVSPPSGRSTQVELWRSTSNEALTLYRVHTGTGAFLDDLTDDEVRDPDRDGYAAMPIVLPNGELNANRFTPPPSDKAAVVRFQDRMWYGVDTGGSEPNSIYFSEVDEPESVPPVNEIVLQQNARDADSLRAMIPYGATLLLLQSRHAFSLTFARQPLLDARIEPIAYRGALNQRCWDIHAGVCYVMDQYGVYSIDQSGAIKNLSDVIDNVFRDEIDFAKSTWNFLIVDAKRKTLRAFAAFKQDQSAGYPTRVLCMSLDSGAWWTERYPQPITAATPVRLSNGDFRCVYAGQGGAYILNEGWSDAGRGAVLTATLTERGAGYRTPPTVTATGGVGGEFEAAINAEGQVSAIFIKNAGHGYSSGALYISPPNDPNCNAPVQAAARFAASPLNVDTPMFPAYRFRGGAAEYVSDTANPKAASSSARNVSLAYKPQQSSCEVSLRMYYNNSPTPRINVAARNRDAGFSHSTVDSAARYDMGKGLPDSGSDTGMARALYAGRTMDDVSSSDHHVAVELAGARKTRDSVVFYQIDVTGTAE